MDKPDNRKIQNKNHQRLADDSFAGGQYIGTQNSMNQPENDMPGLTTKVTEELHGKESFKATLDKYEQLSTLMNHLPGMAYRCINDKNWTMLFVSSGCYKLTGYKASELVNNSKISFARIIHADDQKMVNKAVQAKLHSQRPFKVEYRIIDKSGNEHWVLEQGQIVDYDADGNSFIEGFITDITERKKSEELLLEREKQLKKAQSIGKIGSWKFYLNSKTVTASDESYRIYGAKPGTEITINDIQRYPLPEYRPMLDKALIDLIKDGKDYNVEFKVKRITDGEVIDVHSIAEYDPAENVVTGVIQDITRNKNAEKLLRESEEMYRMLIENSKDAIYILYKRRFEIVNTGFQQMLGYSLDELRDENIDPINFIAPESIQFIEDRIKKLIDGEEVSTRYEFVAVTKSGEKKEVEASVSYFKYKEGIATQGVIRDITERKRNEEKIKSLSEFRNLLVELSANFIYVPLDEIDDSINKSLMQLGQFVGADRSYIFEYDFENKFCNNTYEWCSNGIHPQLDKLQKVPFNYAPNWVETHKNGGIVNIPDVSSLTDKRQRRMLQNQGIKSVLSIPLFNEKKCIGFVGFDSVQQFFHFSKDEIEILQVYAKILANSFERLERVKELIFAKEKAEESDLLKSAFLANMSHEIRTPMNGILGFTNLLKEPKLSGEEKEEFIDIIKQSGERMLNTINDIISISKLDSGTVEVKWSKYDIDKQLDYFYRFFKPEMDKKGLTLKIKKTGPSRLGEITADKEKLNAVLSNLIKNAIKYTEKGTIEIGCRFKKTEVEFYVKDTGIGINPERHNTIFERFMQEDYSSTKPYEGVGLGLSISKGYVEMMGGNIRVKSEKGKGSEFIFTLPLIQ